MEQGLRSVLTLPGDPSSVPQVRRFVRERMASHHPDLVDTAELCISELVTNAVLHAGSEVEVHVADLGDAVRLEVRDRSDVLPHSVVHTTRATTGRGIEMVGLLARSWGCDLLADDGVKAVWCELSTSRDETPVDPLALWGDDDLVPPTPTPSGRPARHVPSQRGTSYVLMGYPVRLGLRAREHDAAILRECVLLSQSAATTSAPARLVALAQTITGDYASEVGESEAARLAAYHRGEAVTDLHYPRVEGAAAIVLAWQDLMTELDTYAAGTSLLALATPPDLVQLRTWVVGEIVRQSDGEAPRPWTGPLA